MASLLLLNVVKEDQIRKTFSNFYFIFEPILTVCDKREGLPRMFPINVFGSTEKKKWKK